MSADGERGRTPLPTALVPARPCLAGTASHAPQHHGTMDVARPSAGRRPMRPTGTTPVRIPATPNAIPATAAALPPIRTGKRLPRPTPTLDALSAKEPLSWPLHRPPSCWKTCLASNSRAEARAPLKRPGAGFNLPFLSRHPLTRGVHYARWTSPREFIHLPTATTRTAPAAAAT